MLTQRVYLHAPQSVLNDEGGTAIAGPHSQNCCHLFEIQNIGVPENGTVSFMYFAYFGVIYNCQNVYCIREGHSLRKREVFAGHLWTTLYLYIARIMPMGLAANTARSGLQAML